MEMFECVIYILFLFSFVMINKKSNFIMKKEELEKIKKIRLQDDYSLSNTEC
jgi:hypothetical protein